MKRPPRKPPTDTERIRDALRVLADDTTDSDSILVLELDRLRLVRGEDRRDTKIR